MSPYPYPTTGQPSYGYPTYVPGSASPNVYGSYPGVMTGGLPTGSYPGTMMGGLPTMPAGTGIPSGTTFPMGTAAAPAPGTTVPGQLPMEESYIENILRLNLGKMATIYMTFENNNQWNAKVFRGVLEAAGRDHIIISDPQTGMRYLLLMVNLDYITFDEELNYAYPWQPSGR